MSNFSVGPVHASYGKVSSINDDNIHINSSKKNTSTALYSARGNIHAEGTAAGRLVLDKARAHYDVKTDHVVIKGAVLSDFGNVFANQSDLGNITAHYNIDLINSSAKDLLSEFGRISSKQTNGTQAKISSINAHQNIEVDHIAVDGKIQSSFGNVSVNRSALNNVTARHNINLINSSAKNLLSEFGNISVKQTTGIQSIVYSIVARHDIEVSQVSTDEKIESEFGNVIADQSTLGSICARHNINLINSSARSLLSEFGQVVVRQTDGIQRSISQITACDGVAIENSNIENITLRINSDQRAVLDLKNTNVSGKITIKVSFDNSRVYDLLKIIRVFFSVFLSYFWKYQESGGDESKHFTLLIKGDAMPKNLFFEGFESDEITTQVTGNEILVNGKKK